MEFIKEIGNGSFGKVIHVRNKRTQEEFAMKESNYMNKSTLLREAFILKSIKHSNIVEFKGYCENDNQKYQYVKDQRISFNKTLPHGYLLMELCSERNLYQMIKEDNRHSHQVIKFLFGQIIQACFHYYYEKRILHRDLKLENILISEDYTIKICDFGFARTNDTEMISLVGTYETMNVDRLSNGTINRKFF